ncbi:hypothetical protein NOM72_01985 [Exiguobacterium sp. LL15]|nr:hypothetical protein [Exiguobacterium sp. LL15]MCQ4089378.1 hypothetical protein [Exiguobacterium sp. LL15]
MIFRKDGDSCGNSGIGKTPQEHTRRGGLPSARGKRRLGRKSMHVSTSFFLPACIQTSNQSNNERNDCQRLKQINQ